jgi:hypothetical protein
MSENLNIHKAWRLRSLIIFIRHYFMDLENSCKCSLCLFIHVFRTENLSVPNQRDYREGWPLLTVETEVKEDSKEYK